MEKKYIKRLIEKSLLFHLESKGAILVIGPKWCGKSRTCELFAKTKIYMQDTEKNKNYYKMAKLMPSRFLNIGEKPILIDEWQKISFIWDSIRFQIDKNNDFGQYILTGSVTFELKNNEHSGIGRIVPIKMRTMSLFESGESSGLISLLDLCKSNNYKSEICNLTLKDYSYLICRGGWPLSINENENIALTQVKDYFNALVMSDIFSGDSGLRNDENKARLFLRSYSRGISSSMSIKTIYDDVSKNETSFDINTVNKYLDRLKKLFVIEELDAFSPNLRSKTAIRTKPVRHFVDPSIATASLGLTPDSLLNDFNTLGLLFESLVIRDLRVYAEYNDAKVYHYRDKKDREIDAIILFPNGDYGAIEIKLGDEDEINKAINNMNKIIDDIDDNNYKKPLFKAVITAGTIFEKIDDNTYIIPLGLLKP